MGTFRLVEDTPIGLHTLSILLEIDNLLQNQLNQLQGSRQLAFMFKYGQDYSGEHPEEKSLKTLNNARYMKSISQNLTNLQDLAKPIRLMLASDYAKGPYEPMKSRIDRLSAEYQKLAERGHGSNHSEPENSSPRDEKSTAATELRNDVFTPNDYQSFEHATGEVQKVPIRSSSTQNIVTPHTYKNDHWSDVRLEMWEAGGENEDEDADADDTFVDPEHSRDQFGQISLSWAAAEGMELIMKLLLSRDGVAPNLEDKYSRTPLFWAVERGHEAIVKLLLNRDDVAVDSRDIFDRTPLLLAVDRGHEEIAKLLLSRDDVAADSRDESGRTPLSLAAEGGHEGIVKLLLSRGDVAADSRDEYGQSPLWWAIEGGHEAIVKLLLSRDDVVVDSRDGKGQTPISLAAKFGHEAIMKLLLSRDKATANS